MGSVVNATITTIGAVLYTSIFVMAFGVIPNILCSEIFPTRVRGLCIAICALTYWIGNIMVTYSTPLMLKSIGLAGVFSLYVIECITSWIFVYLKVPETKGMPLEVICEFFAVGAKQPADAKDNWLDCPGLSLTIASFWFSWKAGMSAAKFFIKRFVLSVCLSVCGCVYKY